MPYHADNITTFHYLYRKFILIVFIKVNIQKILISTMNKKFFLFAAFVTALILTSCSKKLGEFRADYFNTNPTPLTVVGDDVQASITANIPPKFFVKNAEVTITPSLVSETNSIPAQPIIVQGEKVRGNNQVVSFDHGGIITIPARYVYSPDMQTSDLVLDFTVAQGKNTYQLPRVKVGYGVNATSTLADAASVSPALAPDKFQKIINEKYSADIKFLINQTNIRASELQQAEVKGLQQTIKDAQADEKKQIEGINISSYASPEGGVKLNTRIAEGREKSTQQYLDSELKKNNITDAGDLTADFTPQDWEGFQRLVAESNIQDKELILSVLSMYKDPETREREIRNLSSVFDQLRQEVLPKLRYSRLTASINTIGKSDEEMAAAFSANPASLSVEELLHYASTLTSNADRLSAYRTGTQAYPSDFRTWNNLGLCQYKAKDYADAIGSFQKALSLNPQSAEAKMNLGLCSMLNKDMSAANQLLGAAAGVPELNDALGVYYLKTGDYNAAINAFAGAKTNNAALAQILTQDYSSAKNTLASIADPDAITYYLMAILGARTNNETMVLGNLRQAAKLDSGIISRARKDLEFSKFNLSQLF